MKRITLATVLLCLLPTLAVAQAIQQSGPITRFHFPMWVQSGIQKDAGPAGGGAIGINPAELGVTALGTGTPPYVAQGTGPLGTIGCFYDAPTTNATGYHYLCFSPNALGGALIATGAGGTATPQGLNIDINGTPYAFPGPGGGDVAGPGSSVDSNYACFNGTGGLTIKDCGSGINKSSVTVATGGSAAITTNNVQVTITGLTSAQYASESVTLTWASLSSTSRIQATWAGGTSAGTPVLMAVSGASTMTLTLTNVNSAAFNGTAIVNLSILP